MRASSDHSARHQRWSALVIAVVLTVAFGPPVAADPLDPVLGDPGITLPNLVPNVRDTSVVRPPVFDEPSQTFVPGSPQLWFDTHIQNFGSVPLELVFGGVESPDSAAAAQCVSWRTPRLCGEHRPVGGFSWHDEHKHFHFNEFASYELRKVLRNGRVDYSSRGLVAANEKVSFCLIDSEPVREDASPLAFYTTCTPTVEGISAGWTDIYTADLEGQQFSLEGVADGLYALIIRADYLNHIYETDDTDNIVEAILQISNGVSSVNVVGRNYP